jgi:hypothetical protein
MPLEMLIHTRRRAVTMAVAAAVAHGPGWAQSTVSVADLAGARSATGQSEMRARGFTLVHTDTRSDATWQYWWNGARAECVAVTLSDGSFDRVGKADEHDCGQSTVTAPGAASSTEAASVPAMSDGAKVAVGAAALLGVAALLHKSHERKKDRASSSANDTAEYERGYRDGLYHQGYHNYNNHREYSDGYTAGSQKRSAESSYRSYDGRHSGYAAYVNVNDLVGARASALDNDLPARGFRNTGGHKSSSRAYSYWFNGSSRQCVQAVVYDGRVEAMHSANERSCL